MGQVASPGNQYLQSFDAPIRDSNDKLAEMRSNMRKDPLENFRKPDHGTAFNEAVVQGGIGTLIGGAPVGIGAYAHRMYQESTRNPWAGVDSNVAKIADGKVFNLPVFGEVAVPEMLGGVRKDVLAGRISDSLSNKYGFTGDTAQRFRAEVRASNSPVSESGDIARHYIEGERSNREKALAKKHDDLVAQRRDPQTVLTAMQLDNAASDREMRKQEMALKTDELAWQKANAVEDRAARDRATSAGFWGSILTAMAQP